MGGLVKNSNNVLVNKMFYRFISFRTYHECLEWFEYLEFFLNKRGLFVAFAKFVQFVLICAHPSDIFLCAICSRIRQILLRIILTDTEKHEQEEKIAKKDFYL